MQIPARCSLALVALAPLGLAVPIGEGLPAGPPAAPSMRGVGEAPPTLPLSFVENRGQWGPEVQFLSRAAGSAVRVERDAIALCVEHREGESREGHVVRLVLEGAREGARPAGEAAQSGVRNFYVGPRERWATGVRGFGRVRWEELHSGIDLVLREGEGLVEYDVLVAPGAELERFVVRCEGVEEVEVARDGALLLHTAAGPIRQSPPTTWIEEETGPRRVECRYVRLDGKRFGLSVPDRDPERPLVVDPGLVWATYLGGSGEEFPRVMNVDPVTGAATLAGQTTSADFPVQGGPFSTTGGGTDAFVSRLSGDGTTLEWSTYLGGSSGDAAYGLAEGESRAVLVGGSTFSLDFPVTPDAIQSTRAGLTDAFLARLEPVQGMLEYSTYLGGSAQDWIVEIEAVGNVVIAAGMTHSTDFPTTPGAFDETHNGFGDVFVARIDTDTSQLSWSTYLGGSAVEGWPNQFPPSLDSELVDIQLSTAGDVYLVGPTNSADFPTTAGAHREVLSGPRDCFLSTLKSDGSSLLYSTFFGGSAAESPTFLALDAAERFVVTGFAFSTDLPTTSDALQSAHGGGAFDAFLAVLDPTGQGPQDLVYCSYLGGSGNESSIPVDFREDGQVVLSGWTSSADFAHITPGAHDTTWGGDRDIFLLRLDLSDSGAGQLRYGSYLGGSALDNGTCMGLRSDGTAVLAGFSTGADFPTTPLAYDPSFNGGSAWGDVVVARIDPRDVIGTSYCAALPNSTGAAATLHAFGSASLTENDFVLRATPVPDQPFLFFMGPDQTQQPFGDGFRCVGGVVTRLLPTGVGQAWLAERVLDLEAVGVGIGAVNFQCWYRDPAGPGGSGFNLSDAIRVDFVP